MTRGYKIINLIKQDPEIHYCHICCNNFQHKTTIKTIRATINNMTVEFEGTKTYCDICGSETFVTKYIKENINISQSEYIKQKYMLLSKIMSG